MQRRSSTVFNESCFDNIQKQLVPMHWTTLIKICVTNDENVDLNYKKLTKYMKQINISSETGNTPLHFVALGYNLSLASWLIDNGAVIRPNDYGETPLHWACKHGNLEMVKFLLRNMTRYQINIEDLTHKTAVGWAKEYDHSNVAQLIKKTIKC